MPVGQNQVRVAVIIVIQEPQPPPAQQACWAGNSMASTEIRKSLVAVVSVNRKSLLIDVGHEKVLAAVLVEIRRIDPHAGASQPIFAVPHTGSQSDLFEFLAAPVHKQKVGNRVVGLKQVEIPIIINVRGDYAEPFAEAFQNPGFFADVGKM